MIMNKIWAVMLPNGMQHKSATQECSHEKIWLVSK